MRPLGRYLKGSVPPAHDPAGPLESLKDDIGDLEPLDELACSP